MTDPPVPRDGQRVVAVTGGGGGIGAAIAQELGRQGAFVVTMDPLVSLDGSEALPPAEETTAGRIVAAGGSARATSVSVTDGEGVRALFDDLGRLDAVVNVAGITRPTSFARGTEDDWRQVLGVHLDGYVNVLAAALPIMAAAGHGHVLGVTSGSGWRPADTGAYGCAKRAVAALTWQLGAVTPPGIVVNAISPIAVTRMVTAALERAGAASGRATGGLSLGSMPDPEELGPFGAHLVGEGFDACRGRVLFTAGSEVAMVDEPRLLEVVRTDGSTSLAPLFQGVVGPAFAAAEAAQGTGGGGNPRFTAAFAGPGATDGPPAVVRSCLVVAEEPALGTAVAAALAARGVGTTTVAPDLGSASPADALTAAGAADAVVLALRGSAPAGASASGWEQVLGEHAGLADQIHADAAWARAVADLSAAADRAVRLVTLTDATSAGGRSRAQAAAQHARSARGATDERVSAFAVSVEAPPVDEGGPVAELVAHLVASADATALAGAELVVDRGWVGLRSHPRPATAVTLGGPEVPPWLDSVLRAGPGAGP